MLLLAFCLNCINRKYLWALPTPTTFEKVDQTFIIAFPIYSANHNLLMLKFRAERKKQVREYTFTCPLKSKKIKTTAKMQ